MHEFIDSVIEGFKNNAGEVIGAGIAWGIAYIVVHNGKNIMRSLRELCGMFLRMIKHALPVLVCVIILYAGYAGYELLTKGYSDESRYSDENTKPQPVKPVKKEEVLYPYIEIHAVKDVWVSVSFGEEPPVFRRTIKIGDSMRWDLSDTAKVVFGRPSAAQVILNGQDLGIVNPRARRSETYIYNPDGTYMQVNTR